MIFLPVPTVKVTVESGALESIEIVPDKTFAVSPVMLIPLPVSFFSIVPVVSSDFVE